MQQAQTGPLAQKAAETSAAMQQQEQTSPETQELIAAMQQQREQAELKQKLNNYKQWEQQVMACGGCTKHAGGGSIHIDPSKKGTFTAAASRHGMGVQQFAAHVHAHPENYSPAMRKKANFARNSAKWHHAYGGGLNSYATGDEIITADQMAQRDWRWVPYSDLPVGDDLYPSITDTTQSYIVGPNGIVPKSEVLAWANNPDSQFLYQPQNDVALEHEILDEKRRREHLRNSEATEEALWTAANASWMAPLMKRLFIDPATTATPATGAEKVASSGHWYDPAVSMIKNAGSAIKGVAKDVGSFMDDLYGELGFAGSADFQRRVMFPTRTFWGSWFPTAASIAGGYYNDRQYNEAMREAAYHRKMSQMGYSSYPEYSKEVADYYNIPTKFPDLRPDEDIDWGGGGGGESWGNANADTIQSGIVPSLGSIPVVGPIVDNPVDLFGQHAYGGQLNTYRRGGTLSHQDGMIKSILDRYLTDYRITSAYRGNNNKVGKLGGKSAHAHLLDDGSSAALDIVSSDMNRLRQELANPQLQKELAAAGFGILDETDPVTMKRTGATGAHFHVGSGIKGGGFHLNGYGHQSAEAPLPSYMASSGGGLMTITSPSQQQAGPTPWWLASRQEPEAIPEPTSVQPDVAPVGLTPDMFMLDWDPVNGRHTSETATYPKLFAEGGFTDIASMIKAHEGFSPTAYKDGKSQSIGYGFYKHGIAQGIDFNKRMSRTEADAILDSNIAVIKGELHKELGAEKYNNLTEGQLAAFVDTWYQSPKAAKKAARIYKRTGDLDAAAKALAVPGFTKRNADRQAAFYGGLSNSVLSSQSFDSNTTTGSGELITLTQPNQTQQGFTPWWQNAYSTTGTQDEPMAESFNPLTLNVSPDFFKLKQTQPSFPALL